MNYFGYLEGVNGIKTGFTNGAGRCLVTSVLRNDFDIITVVLGADTKKIRTSDSIKLIEYAYKNYELVDLEKLVKEEYENWNKSNSNRIYVYKGKNTKAKTILGEVKYKKYPVLKGEINNIIIDINVNYFYEAPILENKKIGEVKVTLNTREIMKADILNKEKIERKNAIDYLKEIICVK